MDSSQQQRQQQQQPKRKDRPCDACRKRKSRCVVEEGAIICVLCRFHSQQCTFLHSPQARKRRIDDAGEGENSVPRRRRLSSSFPAVTVAESPSSLSSRVIRTKNGTGVEEYDDLEGPSLLKTTLGLRNQHHSRHVGATRGLEPSLAGDLLVNIGGEIPLNGGILRRVSSTESFMLLPDLGTKGYANELDDLEKIEAVVRPHGKALVDMYFRIVFPSFPILHKEVYLEKYSRSYREFSPPLLASVYLLALYYWSYDDSLNKQKKPDVEALEILARKALSDTIHRPKLSTVQAGLLLLQHTDNTDSAELTAQLVSVGYSLGLNLDSTLWRIPQWEKGLRTRLGWALYMQDKWSSLGSGRPSLISSTSWALLPVSSADFPENAAHENDQEGSTEVEKGRILFSYMIQLSIILGDLLDTVFSVRAASDIARAGEEGLKIVLEKAKPIQLRLKEWFGGLPSVLSMDSTPIMKLTSVAYLRLAYIATEITLHRRILLALSRSTDLQLRQICRSVAHERFIFAIGFVQSLKPQHLSSFWYFSSPHNFALIAAFGTLLLSTSSTTEESDFYETKLKEYRWTLKINSENGARYMRTAMSLLDSNMALLAHNASRPKAMSTTTADVVDSEAQFSESGTDLSIDHTQSAETDSPGQFSGVSFDYFSGQQSGTTSPSRGQNEQFSLELGLDSGGWY